MGPPTEESLSQREEERLKMQATFKRNLLYKVAFAVVRFLISMSRSITVRPTQQLIVMQEINNYISGKQVNEIAEELIRKRENLSSEKQDLSIELQQLSQQTAVLSRSPRDPAEFDTIALLKQQMQGILWKSGSSFE